MATTKTSRLNPARPVDPDAWQRLQEAYAACKASGEGRAWHPWTPESCVLLGRRYVLAWGQPPSFTRLRPEYALPPWCAIQREWGTLAAYHAALLQCGCSSAGVRCAEARAIHQRWQSGHPEPSDLLTYKAHLRDAGVWPGKGVWGEA